MAVVVTVWVMYRYLMMASSSVVAAILTESWSLTGHATRSKYQHPRPGAGRGSSRAARHAPPH